MERLGAVLIAGALLLSGGGTEAAPQPTPWLTQFAINFVSNITQSITISKSNVSGTWGQGNQAIREPSLGKQNPIPGRMYYDWPSQQQRVDHGAGAYECVKFYNTSGPCSLFFTPSGMHRVITAGSQTDCCLDLPEIHASPPDWAVRSKPRYLGQIHDPYSGYPAGIWSYPESMGPHGVHMWVEVAPAANFETYPLIFTFPTSPLGKQQLVGVNGQLTINLGPQDYHFDPASLIAGDDTEGVFDLPPGCEKLCQQSSLLLRNQVIDVEIQ